MKIKLFTLLIAISTIFLVGCTDDRYTDVVQNDEAQNEQGSEDTLLKDHLDEVVKAIEDLEAIGIE